MALGAVLGLKGLLLAGCVLRPTMLAKGVVLGGAGATLTAIAVLGAACAARRGMCARREEARPPATPA